MRVGIELRHMEMGASGGQALLLKEVLETLIARHPGHEYFVYGTIFNRGLIAAAGVTVEALPLADTWSYLQHALVRDRIDVLLRGYPSVDTLSFPLRKQIFCIPDLQHEHHPEFFSAADLGFRREAFGRALGGAGAIGTISEFARGTIRASPRTRCRDIFLMPPALRRAGAADADADAGAAFAARLDAIGPYFLYPANLWKHKNHARVIEAFARFRQAAGRDDVALVFTGHPEGWERIAERFPRLPLHHLGFVGDAELRLLYRRALALVFFSLYEGFGMPLLEAFDAGCPVICSNTTSLPEVGADAVLACDPTDTAAMTALMQRIAADGALREALAARGRARLALFSWERSADTLMAALERVAAGPRVQARGEAPLVSIVTPSFNQGRFLRRTIESVLGQTYPRIEYVVVDGGSSDDSAAILASYGNGDGGRVRWVSEPDRGQAHAINKGFARCRGQIRAYLNSDDTLLPHAVERIVAFFDRHPGCDLVYAEANYIDADDRVTGKYNTAPYSFERLMLDCCVCQPAAFWRDTIAEEIGPFDESLDLVMDYDYWLRIARAGGSIIHLEEVIANSRLHEAAKTLSRREEIYAEIFKTCLKHGGYVSPAYFEGLWHHRLYERRTPLFRALALMPRARSLLAAAHHRWFHSRHAHNGARPANGLRLPPAVADTRPAAGARLRQPPPRQAVEGFWPDCWLAARATFATPPVKREGRLYLAGVPACDCALTVTANGALVHEAELLRERFVEIAFPSPRAAPLQLRFSSSATDAEHRDLSFRVLGTNLFQERDY